MRWILALLVSAAGASAQISGVFTVDPAKPASSVNSQTLAAAIGRLSVGVNGHVVFKVAPATFRETLDLPRVTGAASSATVTFVAEGGTAVIEAPVVDPRHCITTRSGASWYRFENFKFTGYVLYGIYLDSANDNVFEQCEIDDGFGFLPSTRTVWTKNTSSRNRFVRCTFRSPNDPVVSVNGSDTVFDGCEFDGLGKAVRLLNVQRARVWNCFFRDASHTEQAAIVVRQDSIFAHNTVIVSSSAACLQVEGPSNAWTLAPVVMNNVLVNLGRGPVIEYGVDSSRLRLYAAVSDYNCIYAPNSRIPVIVGRLTFPTFAGSLAGFRLWQGASSSRIVPGGATTYELNTLASDPQLVSLAAPLDIHLRQGSPLIDAGSTNLTPSYTTYPPVTIGNDIDGDTRVAPVDIGADEVSFGLTASGTGAVGSTMTWRLSAQFDGGLQYQLGTALGSGPIVIGSRFLRLNFDALLVLSISGLAPSVFDQYRGVLNSSGKATAKLVIPAATALRGVKLYTAFVTISTAAPQNIKTISNTVSFTIT